MYLYNTTKVHETGSPNHKTHGWQLHNYLHRKQCYMTHVSTTVDVK